MASQYYNTDLNSSRVNVRMPEYDTSGLLKAGQAIGDSMNFWKDKDLEAYKFKKDQELLAMDKARLDMAATELGMKQAEVGRVNKSAYDAMNSVGTEGLSKNNPDLFDVPLGAQTSRFGSTMSGINAGIQGITGLGSLYYENKSYGLKKDEAEMKKDQYARAVKADEADQANKALMARNAGNGAAYIRS